MSKLQELRDSILNMSHDAKLDMLRRIREDRKMNKAPIVRERKQHDASSKLVKMFEGLSQEERDALVAQLSESM